MKQRVLVPALLLCLSMNLFAGPFEPGRGAATLSNGWFDYQSTLLSLYSLDTGMFALRNDLRISLSVVLFETNNRNSAPATEDTFSAVYGMQGMRLVIDTNGYLSPGAGSQDWSYQNTNLNGNQGPTNAASWAGSGYPNFYFGRLNDLSASLVYNQFSVKISGDPAVLMGNPASLRYMQKGSSVLDDVTVRQFNDGTVSTGNKVEALFAAPASVKAGYDSEMFTLSAALVSDKSDVAVAAQQTLAYRFDGAVRPVEGLEVSGTFMTVQDASPADYTDGLEPIPLQNHNKKIEQYPTEFSGGASYSLAVDSLKVGPFFGVDMYQNALGDKHQTMIGAGVQATWKGPDYRERNWNFIRRSVPLNSTDLYVYGGFKSGVALSGNYTIDDLTVNSSNGIAKMLLSGYHAGAMGLVPNFDLSFNVEVNDLAGASEDGMQLGWVAAGSYFLDRWIKPYVRLRSNKDYAETMEICGGATLYLIPQSSFNFEYYVSDLNENKGMLSLSVSIFS